MWGNATGHPEHVLKGCFPECRVYMMTTNTFKSRMCCHPVAIGNFLKLLEVHPETWQWILLSNRLYIIAVTFFCPFAHNLLPHTSPVISQFSLYS